MNSFSPGFMARQPISLDLLQTIRLLGEFKGKQDMFKEQSPQTLEMLREAAVIQSVESSNRLEGITAPLARIQDLVRDKTAPRNRSEQEIAGYRDVLNTIHTNYDIIPFTPNVILQFHRDLFQFHPAGGGRWKVTENDILETLPDGTSFVRFKPVPAYRTPWYMQELHDRFNQAWDAREIDPLLLIPSYVLDFLCIHPFLDGNGRMARLLTLLLLYKAGYEVGRYISLEKVVESHREGYYDALYRSSRNWHEGGHSLIPWWEYFLGVVILGACRDLETRTGNLTSARGAKKDLVLNSIEKLPKQFKMADLERTSPGVSRPTINRVLDSLKKQGRIRCVRPGRDALWEKLS